jgi:uncharacterized membrane protein
VNGISFGAAVEAVGRAIDIVGVAAIAVGFVIVAAMFVPRLQRREPDLYVSFRQGLGRVILLGLELLVAADIIRTVAVTPTLESVAVLGAIVLVRTFLSFSLEIELSGELPWRRAASGARRPAADEALVSRGPR